MVSFCCLIYDGLFAQSCISVKYDANGNRMQLMIDDCGIKKDIIKKEMIRTEISENGVIDELEYEDDVLLYPNPSEGIVNLKTNVELLSQYEIYNVKGLLICGGEFLDTATIDIRNQPAGVYLLKVICGESVCSKIIVKL